jgi:hypothetical protein
VEVAVIEVLLLKVNGVDVTLPNFTVDVEVKPVPVITTAAPPVAGPAVGVIPVTVGVVSAMAT